MLTDQRRQLARNGCPCSVIQLSRACKQSLAKARVFEQEYTRPFGVVQTEIICPLLESHCGLRYSIALIDQMTRLACTYYMSRKSEAAEKLRRYLAWVKRLGWCVGLVRVDRGGEFFVLDGEHVQKDSEKSFNDFERVVNEHCMMVEAAPRDGSTGNVFVEQYHLVIFEMASSFLRRSRMSSLFWVESYKYAEFLYNRMITASTGEFTSHALVYGRRPRLGLTASRCLGVMCTSIWMIFLRFLAVRRPGKVSSWEHQTTVLRGISCMLLALEWSEPCSMKALCVGRVALRCMTKPELMTSRSLAGNSWAKIMLWCQNWCLLSLMIRWSWKWLIRCLMVIDCGTSGRLLMWLPGEKYQGSRKLANQVMI